MDTPLSPFRSGAYAYRLICFPDKQAQNTVWKSLFLSGRTHKGNTLSMLPRLILTSLFLKVNTVSHPDPERQALTLLVHTHLCIDLGICILHGVTIACCP